jgi:hypothetical protein
MTVALIREKDHVMHSIERQRLWGQFGAAIDMLENAVRACPDDVWRDGPMPHSFWYLVYHTLFWLDFYLTGTPDGFAPPAPYTLSEIDPAGAYPDRAYTKEEMLAYLEHGRSKCRATIGGMTETWAAEPSGFTRLGLSQFELVLYNLRHVQHHTAQLNLLLRQRTNSAPRWVGKTARGLE